MAENPVTLRHVSWSPAAASALETAARGDLDLIAQEVQDGRAWLYQITGEAEGFIVLRLEASAAGQELVIVAAAGRNCRPVIRYLVDLADRKGWTIRTHIVRPGLIRIYERLGFQRREVVVCYGRKQ